MFSKNTRIQTHRTAILPVVLNRLNAWSLALREEILLRVSQNRVLRKVFGLKSDKITGEWRTLYKADLCTPEHITFRDQI